MQIQLEAADTNAIEAYSDSQIKINSIVYQQTLIVNKETIITDWPIHAIGELDINHLSPLLNLMPKIIIIGHAQLNQFVPAATSDYLRQHQIGLECMSIGAACRTYNVLLSEHRDVILVIIFNKGTCGRSDKNERFSNS